MACRFLALISLMAICCLAQAAHADGVGNACPSGTCVIDNPVYVNVYWDASAAQWDSDVGASGMTQKRINAVTMALIKSDYFSQLSQYKVYQPTMLPSITPPCESAPGSMDAVEAVVKDLVACVLRVNPRLNNGNTILVLFMPPWTAGGKWCGTRSAKHDKFGSPVEVVLASTTSACSYDFARLIELASHEMVEAATDPLAASLTGYKNRDPGGQFGEEIGDLCANNQVVNFLGVGEGPSTGVTEYWSDNADNCVVPFSLTPPTINVPITPCGSGKSMSIMLQGVFGPTPWDLTAGTFGGQTLYLSLVVSGADNWSAGNVLNGDAVGLGPIIWRQKGNGYPTDTIVIQGFGAAYGSNGWVVRPGDELTVSVYSVKNGQVQTQSFAAPAPTAVQFDRAPVMNVNSSAGITGTLYASGCPVEGVNLSLAVNRGSVNPPGGVVTRSDGTFAATYLAPAVAGMVTLTASSPILKTPGSETFPASPVLSSLSPTQGPEAAGSNVTVSGQGFDNAAGATTASVVGYIGPLHNVKVSAVPAVAQVNPNHKAVVLVMPASPFIGQGALSNASGGLYGPGGQAATAGPTGTSPFTGSGAGSLTINVNGAQSNALEYTYYVCAASCPQQPSPGSTSSSGTPPGQIPHHPQSVGTGYLPLIGGPSQGQASPIRVGGQRPGTTIGQASGLCAAGFVWRMANAADHVCVTPQTRAQFAADTAASGLHAMRSFGASGAPTCLKGFVWRMADPADYACVTPAARQQAAQDNASAASRVAR